MKNAVGIGMLTLSMVVIPVMSQAQAFEQGDHAMGASIGTGSTFSGYSYQSKLPSPAVQYEYGLVSLDVPAVISIGCYIGYNTSTVHVKVGLSTYDIKWTYTMIALRSAYHWNAINNPKWDVYGGGIVSKNIVRYGSLSSNAIWVSIFLGARYFFSHSVSVYSEIGHGIADFNIGAAVKL